MTTQLSETTQRLAEMRRDRSFAMKQQQKLDRSLESYVRINFTEWQEGASPEAIRKEVKALIVSARKQEGETAVIAAVSITDSGRKPADEMRGDREKTMEKLAKTLPVYPWWEGIKGVGPLGLATIVAETVTDRAPFAISHYPTHSHLWKRLGFAPYDGLAGSSWRREKWRPRALTKEEWIANPFKPERYAFMYMIIESLLKHQTRSKKKTESGETEPTGPYGEAYCRRRAHLRLVHPEWSDMHAEKDARRYTMKKLLRDLWREWHRHHPYQPPLEIGEEKGHRMLASGEATARMPSSSPPA